MADSNSVPNIAGKPLSSFTVRDLKTELEKRGLSKSGSKKELQERLKVKLHLERLQEESVHNEDRVPNLGLQHDIIASQNDFIKQYLAGQQKIYEKQKEARRLIELDERKSDQEASSSQDESTPREIEIKPKVEKKIKVPVPVITTPVLPEAAPKEEEESPLERRQTRSARSKQNVTTTDKEAVTVSPVEDTFSSESSKNVAAGSANASMSSDTSPKKRKLENLIPNPIDSNAKRKLPDSEPDLVEDAKKIKFVDPESVEETVAQPELVVKTPQIVEAVQLKVKGRNAKTYSKAAPKNIVPQPELVDSSPTTEAEPKIQKPKVRFARKSNVQVFHEEETVEPTPPEEPAETVPVYQKRKGRNVRKVRESLEEINSDEEFEESSPPEEPAESKSRKPKGRNARNAKSNIAPVAEDELASSIPEKAQKPKGRNAKQSPEIIENSPVTETTQLTKKVPRGRGRFARNAKAAPVIELKAEVPDDGNAEEENVPVQTVNKLQKPKGRNAKTSKVVLAPNDELPVESLDTSLSNETSQSTDTFQKTKRKSGRNVKMSAETVQPETADKLEPIQPPDFPKGKGRSARLTKSNQETLPQPQSDTTTILGMATGYKIPKLKGRNATKSSPERNFQATEAVGQNTKTEIPPPKFQKFKAKYEASNEAAKIDFFKQDKDDLGLHRLSLESTKSAPKPVHQQQPIPVQKSVEIVEASGSKVLKNKKSKKDHLLEKEEPGKKKNINKNGTLHKQPDAKTGYQRQLLKEDDSYGESIEDIQRFLSSQDEPKTQPSQSKMEIALDEKDQCSTAQDDEDLGPPVLEAMEIKPRTEEVKKIEPEVASRLENSERTIPVINQPENNKKESIPRASEILIEQQPSEKPTGQEATKECNDTAAPTSTENPPGKEETPPAKEETVTDAETSAKKEAEGATNCNSQTDSSEGHTLKDKDCLSIPENQSKESSLIKEETFIVNEKPLNVQSVGSGDKSVHKRENKGLLQYEVVCGENISQTVQPPNTQSKWPIRKAEKIDDHKLTGVSETLSRVVEISSSSNVETVINRTRTTDEIRVVKSEEPDQVNPLKEQNTIEDDSCQPHNMEEMVLKDLPHDSEDVAKTSIEKFSHDDDILPEFPEPKDDREILDLKIGRRHNHFAEMPASYVADFPEDLSRPRIRYAYPGKELPLVGQEAPTVQIMEIANNNVVSLTDTVNLVNRERSETATVIVDKRKAKIDILEMLVADVLKPTETDYQTNIPVSMAVSFCGTKETIGRGGITLQMQMTEDQLTEKQHSVLVTGTLSHGSKGPVYLPKESCGLVNNDVKRGTGTNTILKSEPLVQPIKKRHIIMEKYLNRDVGSKETATSHLYSENTLSAKEHRVEAEIPNSRSIAPTDPNQSLLETGVGKQSEKLFKGEDRVMNLLKESVEDKSRDDHYVGRIALEASNKVEPGVQVISSNHKSESEEGSEHFANTGNHLSENIEDLSNRSRLSEEVKDINQNTDFCKQDITDELQKNIKNILETNTKTVSEETSVVHVMESLDKNHSLSELEERAVDLSVTSKIEDKKTGVIKETIAYEKHAGQSNTGDWPHLKTEVSGFQGNDLQHVDNICSGQGKGAKIIQDAIVNYNSDSRQAVAEVHSRDGGENSTLATSNSSTEASTGIDINRNSNVAERAFGIPVKSNEEFTVEKISIGKSEPHTNTTDKLSSTKNEWISDSAQMIVMPTEKLCAENEDTSCERELLHATRNILVADLSDNSTITEHTSSTPFEPDEETPLNLKTEVRPRDVLKENEEVSLGTEANVTESNKLETSFALSSETQLTESLNVTSTLPYLVQSTKETSNYSVDGLSNTPSDDVIIVSTEHLEPDCRVCPSSIEANSVDLESFEAEPQTTCTSDKETAEAVESICGMGETEGKYEEDIYGDNACITTCDPTTGFYDYCIKEENTDDIKSVINYGEDRFSGIATMNNSSIKEAATSTSRPTCTTKIDGPTCTKDVKADVSYNQDRMELSEPGQKHLCDTDIHACSSNVVTTTDNNEDSDAHVVEQLHTNHEVVQNNVSDGQGLHFCDTTKEIPPLDDTKVIRNRNHNDADQLNKDVLPDSTQGDYSHGYEGCDKGNEIKHRVEEKPTEHCSTNFTSTVTKEEIKVSEEHVGGIRIDEGKLPKSVSKNSAAEDIEAINIDAAAVNIDEGRVENKDVKIHENNENESLQLNKGNAENEEIEPSEIKGHSEVSEIEPLKTEDNKFEHLKNNEENDKYNEIEDVEINEGHLDIEPSKIDKGHVEDNEIDSLVIDEGLGYAENIDIKPSEMKGHDENKEIKPSETEGHAEANEIEPSKLGDNEYDHLKNNEEHGHLEGNEIEPLVIDEELGHAENLEIESSETKEHSEVNDIEPLIIDEGLVEDNVIEPLKIQEVHVDNKGIEPLKTDMHVEDNEIEPLKIEEGLVDSGEMEHAKTDEPVERNVKDNEIDEESSGNESLKIDEGHVECNKVEPLQINEGLVEGNDIEPLRIDERHTEENVIEPAKIDEGHLEDSETGLKIDEGHLEEGQVGDNDIEPLRIDEGHVEDNEVEPLKIDEGRSEDNQIELSKMDKEHLVDNEMESLKSDEGHLEGSEVEPLTIDEDYAEDRNVAPSKIDEKHPETNEIESSKIVEGHLEDDGIEPLTIDEGHVEDNDIKPSNIDGHVEDNNEPLKTNYEEIAPVNLFSSTAATEVSVDSNADLEVNESEPMKIDQGKPVDYVTACVATTNTGNFVNMDEQHFDDNQMEDLKIDSDKGNEIETLKTDAGHVENSFIEPLKTDGHVEDNDVEPLKTVTGHIEDNESEDKVTESLKIEGHFEEDEVEPLEIDGGHGGDNHTELSKTDKEHLVVNEIEPLKNNEGHIKDNVVKPLTTDEGHAEVSEIESLNIDKGHLEYNEVDPMQINEGLVEDKDTEHLTTVKGHIMHDEIEPSKIYGRLEDKEIETLKIGGHIEDDEVQPFQIGAGHIEDNNIEPLRNDEEHVEGNEMEFDKSHFEDNEVETLKIDDGHGEDNHIEPSKIDKEHLDVSEIELLKSVENDLEDNKIEPLTIDEGHVEDHDIAPSKIDKEHLEDNEIEPLKSVEGHLEDNEVEPLTIDEEHVEDDDIAPSKIEKEHLEDNEMGPLKSFEGHLEDNEVEPLTIDEEHVEDNDIAPSKIDKEHLEDNEKGPLKSFEGHLEDNEIEPLTIDEEHVEDNDNALSKIDNDHLKDNEIEPLKIVEGHLEDNEVEPLTIDEGHVEDNDIVPSRIYNDHVEDKSVEGHFEDNEVEPLTIDEGHVEDNDIAPARIDEDNESKPLKSVEGHFEDNEVEPLTIDEGHVENNDIAPSKVDNDHLEDNESGPLKSVAGHFEDNEVEPLTIDEGHVEDNDNAPSKIDKEHLENNEIEPLRSVEGHLEDNEMEPLTIDEGHFEDLDTEPFKIDNEHLQNNEIEPLRSVEGHLEENKIEPLTIEDNGIAPSKIVNYHLEVNGSEPLKSVAGHFEDNEVETLTIDEGHVEDNDNALSKIVNDRLEVNGSEPLKSVAGHFEDNEVEPLTIDEGHVEDNDNALSKIVNDHLEVNGSEPLKSVAGHLEDNEMEPLTIDEGHVEEHNTEPLKTNKEHLEDNEVEPLTIDEGHVEDNDIAPSRIDNDHVEDNEIKPLKSVESHFEDNEVEPLTIDEGHEDNEIHKEHLEDNEIKPLTTNYEHIAPVNFHSPMAATEESVDIDVHLEVNKSKSMETRQEKYADYVAASTATANTENFVNIDEQHVDDNQMKYLKIDSEKGNEIGPLKIDDGHVEDNFLEPSRNDEGPIEPSKIDEDLEDTDIEVLRIGIENVHDNQIEPLEIDEGHIEDSGHIEHLRIEGHADNSKIKPSKIGHVENNEIESLRIVEGLVEALKTNIEEMVPMDLCSSNAAAEEFKVHLEADEIEAMKSQEKLADHITSAATTSSEPFVNIDDNEMISAKGDYDKDNEDEPANIEAKPSCNLNTSSTMVPEQFVNNHEKLINDNESEPLRIEEGPVEKNENEPLDIDEGHVDDSVMVSLKYGGHKDIEDNEGELLKIDEGHIGNNEIEPLKMVEDNSIEPSKVDDFEEHIESSVIEPLKSDGQIENNEVEPFKMDDNNEIDSHVEDNETGPLEIDEGHPLDSEMEPPRIDEGIGNNEVVPLKIEEHVEDNEIEPSKVDDIEGSVVEPSKINGQSENNKAEPFKIDGHVDNIEIDRHVDDNEIEPLEIDEGHVEDNNMAPSKIDNDHLEDNEIEPLKSVACHFEDNEVEPLTIDEGHVEDNDIATSKIDKEHLEANDNEPLGIDEGYVEDRYFKPLRIEGHSDNKIEPSKIDGHFEDNEVELLRTDERHAEDNDMLPTEIEGNVGENLVEPSNAEEELFEANQIESLTIDRHVVNNEIESLRNDEGHVKNNEIEPLKIREAHCEDNDEPLQIDEGHVEDNELVEDNDIEPLRIDDGYIADNEIKPLKIDEGHFEDSEIEPLKIDEGHVEDSDIEPLRIDEGHLEGNETELLKTNYEEIVPVTMPWTPTTGESVPVVSDEHLEDNEIKPMKTCQEKIENVNTNATSVGTEDFVNIGEEHMNSVKMNYEKDIEVEHGKIEETLTNYVNMSTATTVREQFVNTGNGENHVSDNEIEFLKVDEEEVNQIEPLKIIEEKLTGHVVTDKISALTITEQSVNIDDENVDCEIESLENNEEKLADHVVATSSTVPEQFINIGNDGNNVNYEIEPLKLDKEKPANQGSPNSTNTSTVESMKINIDSDSDSDELEPVTSTTRDEDNDSIYADIKLNTSFNSDCVESSAAIIAEICDAVETHAVMDSEEEISSSVHEIHHNESTNNSDCNSEGLNKGSLIDTREQESIASRPSTVHDREKLIDGSTHITNSIIVVQDVITQNNAENSSVDVNNPIFAESSEIARVGQQLTSDINTYSDKDLRENLSMPSDETRNLRVQRIKNLATDDSVNEYEEIQNSISECGPYVGNGGFKEDTTKRSCKSAVEDNEHHPKESFVTVEESISNNLLQNRAYEITKIQASKRDVEFIEDGNNESFIESSNMDVQQTSVESYSGIKKLDNKEYQDDAVPSCVGNSNTDLSQNMVEMGDRPFAIRPDISEKLFGDSDSIHVPVSALEDANTKECGSEVEEDNTSVFENVSVDSKKVSDADVENSSTKASETLLIANDNADAKYLNIESFVRDSHVSPFPENSNVEDSGNSVEAIDTSTFSAGNHITTNEQKSFVDFNNSNNHENLVEENCIKLCAQIPSPVSQHHNQIETTTTSFVNESNTESYTNSTEYHGDCQIISKSSLEVGDKSGILEDSNIQECKRSEEWSDVERLNHVEQENPNAADDGSSHTNFDIEKSKSEEQVRVAQSSDDSLGFENTNVEKCKISTDTVELSSFVENINTEEHRDSVQNSDIQNSSIEEHKNSVDETHISSGVENSNVDKFKNSCPPDDNSFVEHSNIEEHDNLVESNDNVRSFEKSSTEEQQTSDESDQFTTCTSVENSNTEVPVLGHSFEATDSMPPTLGNLNIEEVAVFGKLVNVEESNIEERKNSVQIDNGTSWDKSSKESDIEEHKKSVQISCSTSWNKSSNIEEYENALTNEKRVQVKSFVEKLVSMVESDDFVKKRFADEHDNIVDITPNTSNIQSPVEGNEDSVKTSECKIDSNIEECYSYRYTEFTEVKTESTEIETNKYTIENIVKDGDSICTESKEGEYAVTCISDSKEVSHTIGSKIEATLEDVEITSSKRSFTVAPSCSSVIKSHILVNNPVLNEHHFSVTGDNNSHRPEGQKAVTCIENVNSQTACEEITTGIMAPIEDNRKESMGNENFLEFSGKEKLVPQEDSISTNPKLPVSEDVQVHRTNAHTGISRNSLQCNAMKHVDEEQAVPVTAATETTNLHKERESCPKENLWEEDRKLEAENVSDSTRDVITPKGDTADDISRNSTFLMDHLHYRAKITPESLFDLTSTVLQSAADHLVGENYLRKGPDHSWARKELSIDAVPVADIKRINSSRVVASEVLRLSKKEKTCQQECSTDYGSCKYRSAAVDYQPQVASRMVGRKVRRFTDSKVPDDDVPNTITSKDHKLDSPEEKVTIKEDDDSTSEVSKSTNCSSNNKNDVDKETGDKEMNRNDRPKAVDHVEDASDHKGKRKFSSGSDSSSSRKSRSPSPEERAHKKRTSSSSDTSSDEKETSRPKGGSKHKRLETSDRDGGDVLDVKTIKQEKEEMVPEREVFSDVQKDDLAKQTKDDHPVETSDAISKEADLKRNVEKEKPPQIIKIHNRKLSLSGNKENDKDANSENSDAKVPRKRKWGAFTKAVPKALPSISTESLKDLIPDYKPVVSAAPIIDESPYEMLPIEEETVVMEEKLPVILPKPPPKIHHSSNFISEDKHKVIPHEEIMPPSPPKNPMTCIVHIRNLTRPFTLTQLKGELGKTGTLVDDGFWIDKIKSKCYVTYETEEQAAATRQALHGVRWPPSNPKSLTVDFSTKEELDFHKELGDAPMPKPELFIDIQKDVRHVNQEVHPMPEARRPLVKEERTRKRDKEKSREVPMREWDRDKLTQDLPTNDERGGKDRIRDKERSKDRREKTEKKESKKKHEEETPAKLLDDLFRKTKATPCIYWLPLTEEQREEAKKHREEEREKRRQRINQGERDLQETDRRQRQRERDNRSVRDRETSRRSRSRSRSPSGRRR